MKKQNRKTEPGMVHITCNGIEKPVNKRQAKTMYMLGFTPLLFITVNGLDCVRWNREFQGIGHSATISILFQGHRVISLSQAVHKIVQMAYRECERDILQHIRGPKLYIQMTPESPRKEL